MTPAQKTTLKTAIQANPTANALMVTGDLSGLATFCNAPAAPDFWVWRSLVSDSELYESTVEGTSWSWSVFIGRSQGERDAWRQMVNMKGGINAALVNTRTGIADIFSGAGGATQRAFLLAIGRRLATFAEKVLATGAGSTAVPATMGFEGLLTFNDFVGSPFQG